MSKENNIVPKDGKTYTTTFSPIDVKWAPYTDERTKKRMKAEGRYQYLNSKGKWMNIPDEVFIIESFE